MNLLAAAKNGNIERIKTLLDSGAEIDSKNNDGYTALMLASRYSNSTSSIDTVKLLLDYGADPNGRTTSGATALMYASKNSNSTPISQRVGQESLF